MAKPDAATQLSLDSATVWEDAAGIPESAYAFQSEIYLKLDVSRLAAMYEEGGRKPIDPRLLAGITILQYMEGASDREAVRNTLLRRDWRVMLGIPSDYRGFHPTVLVRFRQRLRDAGLEEALFASVLEIARGMGMLRDRHRVRVDATKLLADVSMLNRGDLVRETMRGVLADLSKLAETDAVLASDPEFERLYELHGEETWLGRPAKRAELIGLAEDGYALLALCVGRSVKRAALLKQVLAENFVVEDGEVDALEKKEMSTDRIRTPHDPDVKLGAKKDQVWFGDQVHLAETADPDDVNLVVGVLVEDPRREDSTLLGAMRDLARGEVPGMTELLADSGYASLANTLESEAEGVRLVAPPRSDSHKGTYRPSDFTLDFENRTARCPAGHACAMCRDWRDGKVEFGWRDTLCAACPLRPQCKTKGEQGRRLIVSVHWPRLQAERLHAQTHAFWEIYRLRAGIETTFSELVRRHGLRRSRYRTAAGRRMHALFAVTALNTKRLIRWILEGGAAGHERTKTEACMA